MASLADGDPACEAWSAWNPKEVVRQIYDHTDTALAVTWATDTEIVRDFADESMRPEVRRPIDQPVEGAGRCLAPLARLQRAD